MPAAGSVPPPPPPPPPPTLHHNRWRDKRGRTLFSSSKAPQFRRSRYSSPLVSVCGSDVATVRRQNIILAPAKASVQSTPWEVKSLISLLCVSYEAVLCRTSLRRTTEQPSPRETEDKRESVSFVYCPSGGGSAQIGLGFITCFASTTREWSPPSEDGASAPLLFNVIISEFTEPLSFVSISMC